MIDDIVFIVFLVLCGGDVRGFSGIILFFGYLEFYLNFLNCIWIVDVIYGKGNLFYLRILDNYLSFYLGLILL